MGGNRLYVWLFIDVQLVQLYILTVLLSELSIAGLSSRMANLLTIVVGVNGVCM